MQTYKRPAAMIAAAVVALAMVSPTAALATNGDRDKDRHDASERRDHDGERDRDRDRDRDRGDKHERRGEYDKAKRDDRHEADRTKADQARKTKHDKNKHDKGADRTKADRTTKAKYEGKAKHDDKANYEGKGDADRAKADQATRTKHDDKTKHDNKTKTDRAKADKGGPWNVKAPVCHATASETNPYVMITVSHRSIVKGAGHGGHADDIIPPFTYQPHRGADPVDFPGQNWDAEGQALFAEGCLVAADEVAADADERDEDRKGGADKDRDDVTGDEVDRDRGPWNVKAPLCHATSSETNPYVMITVSHRSIVKDAGHGGHADDIIPPFAYQPHRGADSAVYPGLNWDAEGQALFADGCVTPTADEVAGVGGDLDDTDTIDGTDDTGTNDGTDDANGTEADVADVTDEAPEDEVLGVVLDNDDESPAGDVEVLGVSGEADDDTATATEADALADTEVQAAQSSDEDSSSGVLAMTGGSLLILLIAGLASLFAGTGLLRRRS